MKKKKEELWCNYSDLPSPMAYVDLEDTGESVLPGDSEDAEKDEEQ